MYFIITKLDCVKTVNLLILMFALTTYFSGLSFAQQLKLPSKPVLTLEVAKELAKAATEFANKNNWGVVIAIVDDGGHLLYLERMDDVQIASIELAIQKAKTAAGFKRKSKVFHDAVKAGRTELIALPVGIPFDGGVPLIWNNYVIGAIGISGVTAEQDGMIGEYAADSLTKILK